MSRTVSRPITRTWWTITPTAIRSRCHHALVRQDPLRRSRDRVADHTAGQAVQTEERGRENVLHQTGRETDGQTVERVPPEADEDDQQHERLDDVRRRRQHFAKQYLDQSDRRQRAGELTG